MIKNMFKKNDALLLVLTALSLIIGIIMFVDSGVLISVSLNDLDFSYIINSADYGNVFLISLVLVLIEQLVFSILALSYSFLNIIGIVFKKIEWNLYACFNLVIGVLFYVILNIYTLINGNDKSIIIEILLSLVLLGLGIFSNILQNRKLKQLKK